MRIARTIARTIVLALAAGAATAAPALAQNRAAAAVTGVHYTLTDLAPDDAIAPALAYTNVAGSFLVQGLASTTDGETWQRYDLDWRPDGPAAYVQDLPFAHVGLGSTGTGAVAAAVLEPGAGTGANTYLRAGYLQPFRLAPHTAVEYSAEAAISLALDTGIAVAQGDTGGAGLSLSSLETNDMPTTDWAYTSADTSPDAHLGLSADLARTLSVTRRNDTDAWMDIYIGVEAYVLASVDSGISPVPEPSGWATLALGSGLLGLRQLHQLRRRRRAA